ncbi:MAG TPA: nucleotide sugar dehydrogenase [Pyrinomonadaceae bacterium]|jgi:UDPglucose 6-dehydrogenase
MIGFAGLSHLGIVSSIATAAKGFEVVAYGETETLCERLNSGQPPFFEPGLAELLTSNQARINFTADASRLAGCEVIYFALDVPTDDQGKSDLSPLVALLKKVIQLAAPETLLVVLSQVPPGFTRRLARRLEGTPETRSLQLFYQVETLIFGRAVERALYPERYIVGCLNPHAPLPPAYAELLKAFDCPILPMRYESAELTKISINMCLVSSVSVANTMAELCENIGADWSEMIPALKLDRRIGQYAYLSPGLGIAGGNLERDLATVVSLANEFGTDDGVVDAWIANSRYRRDWALKVIHEKAISRNENPLIVVWGLAYKQDTTSTKNSPALALVDALKPFPVRAYDPQVVLKDEHAPTFTQVASALEALEGADVLAVMTPWSEFSSISVAQIQDRMKGRLIVDPFGMLDERECIEAGFSYFKLGSSIIKEQLRKDD